MDVKSPQNSSAFLICNSIYDIFKLCYNTMQKLPDVQEAFAIDNVHFKIPVGIDIKVSCSAFNLLVKLNGRSLSLLIIYSYL